MPRHRRERGIRRAIRRAIGGAGLCLAALFALSPPAPAQTGPAEASSRIAVVSQEQVFANSAFGRAVLARAEAARAELQAENQRLDAALEAEERSLTSRRAALGAEAFRPLAQAFDEKVKGIRAAQDSKARQLARQAEDNRERFLTTIRPVLADLLRESGADLLLDRSVVLIAGDAIDLTDLAVARIDAQLGDGSQPPAQP